MARLTRKERARRAAISKGVRRYWRRVKAVQRAERVPLSAARREVRELPRVGFKQALAARVREREGARRERGFTQEEFAFNLRDRDTEQGFGLYRKFRRQDEVTLRVTWEYRAEPGAPVERGETELTFQPGETEDEFWSNYFAAVREYHDQVLAEQGGTDGGYDRFAFFVQSAA
jgi:hypothetical protein